MIEATCHCGSIKLEIPRKPRTLTACNCLTHWEAAKNPGSSRMGVNTRNVDPEVMKAVRIRNLDGARTWKFLD